MLKKGDVLVLNDTRVIKARLIAVKENGSRRELIILEKHGFDSDWYTHRVLYRRKLAKNDKLRVGTAYLVVKEIIGDGVALVCSDVDILELANKCGDVPLPPYMHRNAVDLDIDRYQTVWANDAGSVAAPTASLNMTDEIITTLRKNGVIVVYLTLHVGLGTFLPIRADNVEDHQMHQEYFEIPNETARAIQTAKSADKRVIALGTTVARTLEYAADLFEGGTSDFCGEADIFIYPGYEFKLIDGLLTNFHAPKSTVLMLTAAFAGWDKLLPAYEHAISNNYRFLSYGDSMLIL
jgi:S-adenosylmethionine:tRNA ribosyltransferase-isomerase